MYVGYAEGVDPTVGFTPVLFQWYALGAGPGLVGPALLPPGSVSWLECGDLPLGEYAWEGSGGWLPWLLEAFAWGLLESLLGIFTGPLPIWPIEAGVCLGPCVPRHDL